MAQVILGGLGGALGGSVGRMLGSAAGARLDRLAIASLEEPRQIGPRLDGMRIQGTSEGAPIPAAFGRVRLVGQVIWAARFTEHRREGRSGKGGPRSVDYGYSLSFAVGLCEGPIDGVGRVWADGDPLDLSAVTMRLHRGGEDQAPDSLIEAVEGAAPAYRGLAYAVFEDLPLEAFGDRLPQLAFEVFRRPRGAEARLEDKLEGVCLIPGSGEFVYATQPVLRRESLIRTAAENVNNPEARADLTVSLDQLQARLPNLKRVTLVVSWFGDDLRCGECRVRPGVERADKATLGETWRVSGVDRAGAHLVSEVEGGPAYGGTPSDASVISAVQAMKARGLAVTLAPFLMMDVPADSGLADPWGGAEQAAYPWRGRVTCHPAPGQAGTPDATAGAEAQVEAFFGEAAATDFAIEGANVTYDGPEDGGWRRMVLHYAHLALIAEADGLLVGSELRGLTSVRGLAGYPAVEALRALAQDCRAVMGPTALITYAADWSEWSGVQHPDDPDGFVFHLDALWADPAVSCIGIDWYPPLSDWRDGDGHLDALEGFAGPADAAYLAERVQAGEAYDWWYPDAGARAAQARHPIEDGAHGEPWMFRAKDLAGWWSHAHHDRVGGARGEEPTDWTPGCKPIRLIEFGCPAIDRGANAPNLFLDPKSAESAAPPFSSGARDDRVQRRTLEAVLDVFADSPANPQASAYEGRMIEAMDAWCWDARPFPDFPARTEVWADGPNWATGHWLNGRLNGEAADLIAALAARAGLSADHLDLGGVEGSIEGYLVDRPMSAAEAMAPLLLALGVETAERGGRVGLVNSGGPILMLGDAQMALGDGGGPIRRSRRLEPGPAAAQVCFIDAASDYATGSVTVRDPERTGGGTVQINLPMVTHESMAEAAGRAALARWSEGRDTADVEIGPLAALRLEPGDRVALEGDEIAWRVERLDRDESPTVRLGAAPAPGSANPGDPDGSAEPGPMFGPPWVSLLDIPWPGETPDDDSLMVAVAAEPWRPIALHAGPDVESLTWRDTVPRSATVGRLLSPLTPGVTDRWDETGEVFARIEGGEPRSRSAAAVLNGANQAAVRAADGAWELLQFRGADLAGPTEWRLTGLLRGRFGTEAQAAVGAVAGADFVMLDGGALRIGMPASERGLSLTWRAAPVGFPAGGAAMTQTALTWLGLARKPWSPAHLRIRQEGGDSLISWIRRSRAHGDGWDIEPPLNEERELYRVEVWAGDVMAAAYEATAPQMAWTAAQQAEVFPEGLPADARVRVAQGSAIWGWGAWAQAAL